MKRYTPCHGSRPALDVAKLRSLKPRSYVEWKALKRWGKLPAWELPSVGYILREARESAELTQKELAQKLCVSQQAVSQAERWNANPTVNFIRAWCSASGAELSLSFP